MKNLLLFAFTILLVTSSFAQTDQNGNPVFNSVSTKERSFDGFTLISNYYTLKHNIENKKSSVFILENPTLDQIENAAVHLPSDFFMVTRDNKMVVMVMLQNDPKRQFLVVEMKNNNQSYFPLNLKGDITENRANEIIKEKYDPAANIENAQLNFNGKVYAIITTQEIEDHVLALIKKEKLDKKKPSDLILRSKNEIKTLIISETKEGGKLDFFTEIRGSENDGIQIKPGVLTTKQSVALYKWGRACFEIGVNTVEDAYEIFADFKGKPVSKRDQDYIKMGFYKEWEK